MFRRLLALLFVAFLLAIPFSASADTTGTISGTVTNGTPGGGSVAGLPVTLYEYQGMNIVAGILIVIYTLSLKAYATTGLNAVWALIGFYTLGRKWFTRN